LKRLRRSKPLKGLVMAVAKQVRKVESTALAWLEIEDEDGAKYRYAKRGLAPDGSPLHVAWEFTGGPLRAKLVREDDGRPVLRQEGPGLPAKIVVDYIELTAMPGAPFLGGWGGRYEYEQE
jgi:hypothetical protein